VPVHDEILMHVVARLDDETFIHCRRVKSLALSLGKTAGLPPTELKLLGQGAFFHDIGKSFLPRDVLQKQAPLSPRDRAIIKMHPKLGWDFAELIGLEEGVKRIILEHHLWADGRDGYPDELTGCKPCFLAQITAVADAVDSMTSDYRTAKSLDACLEYLEENAGTKFSRTAVEIFKAAASKGLVPLPQSAPVRSLSR
jgi:putative nucleotidyltransferase with HDIG domain